MKTNWLLGSLTIAYALFEFLLIAIIIRARADRRWLSVLTYCVAGLASDSYLFANQQNYRHYFYAYWLWTFCSAIMRLWILFDVFRAIPGTGFVPRLFPRFIAGFAATLALAGIILTAGDGSQFASATGRLHLVHTVVIIDRSATIGSGVFLAIALLGVSVLRLGWTKQAVVLCSGLGLKFACAMLFGMLISFASREGRLLGNAMDDLSGCAMLAIWCYGISLPRQEFTWADQVEYWMKHAPAQ